MAVQTNQNTASKKEEPFIYDFSRFLATTATFLATSTASVPFKVGSFAAIDKRTSSLRGLINSYNGIGGNPPYRLSNLYGEAAWEHVKKEGIRAIGKALIIPTLDPYYRENISNPFLAKAAFITTVSSLEFLCNPWDVGRTYRGLGMTPPPIFSKQSMVGAGGNAIRQGYCVWGSWYTVGELGKKYLRNNTDVEPGSMQECTILAVGQTPLSTFTGHLFEQILRIRQIRNQVDPKCNFTYTDAAKTMLNNSSSGGYFKNGGRLGIFANTILNLSRGSLAIAGYNFVGGLTAYVVSAGFVKKKADSFVDMVLNERDDFGKNQHER